MPNHKSAIRELRRNLRRNQINKRNKSILRTQIKNLRTAIQDKDKEAAEKILPQTFSVIDQSIKKGAIHENTGNRYKSRLTKQISMMETASIK